MTTPTVKINDTAINSETVSPAALRAGIEAITAEIERRRDLARAVLADLGDKPKSDRKSRSDKGSKRGDGAAAVKA